MKRSFCRILVLTLSVSALAGCSPAPTGSPIADGAKRDNQRDPLVSASSAASSTATKQEAQPNKADHSSTKSEDNSQASKHVDGSDGVVTKNAGSPPSTSAKAIAMLDMAGMPRIQEKSLLQISPTQLSYTCGSSVTSVDAFYRAELANRKWSEVKGNAPVSDIYLERTFQKDGYIVRYTASEGSSKEETSFFFAHLGNVDVQQLPKPIQVKTQSVPNSTTNATHLSPANIDEIAKDLTEKMIGLGWQRCTESQDSAIDVPHFRSINFRKEGVRVHLGMARNPDASKNETNVFYHAESMLPYDVPASDSKESLMFNPGNFEASLPWKGDRQSMVQWLINEGKRFDWVVEPTEDFVAGKTHGVYVQTSSGFATMVRLVESKGVLSVRFYPTALRKDPKTPEPAKIAGPTPAPNNDSTVSSSGPSPEFEAMRAQVDAKIQDELSKALGSIPGAEKKSINELQSHADALLKKMSEETTGQEDKVQKASTNRKSNPFDVPEDKEPIVEKDQEIQHNSCTILHANQQYPLEHCVAYTMMKHGKPTKMILFSAAPISKDKVIQLLKRGEAVHVFDVCDPAKPALDIEVWGDSVTINAIFDGNSMATNSDDLRSTIRYRDSKFIGRVFTAKPMSLGGERFEIAVDLLTTILPPASLMAGFSTKSE